MIQIKLPDKTYRARLRRIRVSPNLQEQFGFPAVVYRIRGMGIDVGARTPRNALKKFLFAIYQRL